MIKGLGAKPPPPPETSPMVVGRTLLTGTGGCYMLAAFASEFLACSSGHAQHSFRAVLSSSSRTHDSSRFITNITHLVHLIACETTPLSLTHARTHRRTKRKHNARGFTGRTEVATDSALDSFSRFLALYIFVCICRLYVYMYIYPFSA